MHLLYAIRFQRDSITTGHFFCRLRRPPLRTSALGNDVHNCVVSATNLTVTVTFDLCSGRPPRGHQHVGWLDARTCQRARAASPRSTSLELTRQRTPRRGISRRLASCRRMLPSPRSHEFRRAAQSARQWSRRRHRGLLSPRRPP